MKTVVLQYGDFTQEPPLQPSVAEAVFPVVPIKIGAEYAERAMAFLQSEYPQYEWEAQPVGPELFYTFTGINREA